MLTNEQLLERLDAAFKSAITTTTAGTAILNPTQFDRYVRALQINANILAAARQVKMDTNIYDVDKVGFSARIMGVPVTEGTERDVATYGVIPAFSRVRLTAQEVQGVVGITDKLLRRAVERGNFENTLIDMMGERAGIDVEELGLCGNTGHATDTYLQLLDGWLIKAGRYTQELANDDITDSFITGAAETTHSIDHGQEGVPITPSTWTLSIAGPTQHAHDDGNGAIVEDASSGISGTIDYISGHVELAGLMVATTYTYDYDCIAFDLSAADYPECMFEVMLTAVPKAYFRNPEQFRFMVPWAVENLYRSLLKARGTALGDEAQTKSGGLAYKGVPLLVNHNMLATRSLLTHPDNLLYGIFHEVQLEREREAKAKRSDFIINTEMAFDYEEAEAAVVAIIS